MLSLESLQKTIARSVLDSRYSGLLPFLDAGHASPYGRLRIYRNNTRFSLTSTLMAVFPITLRLVDERFFRYAASEFVRRNPPREPRLVRYGSDFPTFLRTFPALKDMPFVAETARLEWAIAESLDEPSRPACSLAALETGGETTPLLVIQPSLRLVISHWPVLTIWSAHQTGGDVESLRLDERRPERIALWRHGDNVRFSLLGGAKFSFRHSLKLGLGLEKAVSRALTHDPMFDLTDALVSLFNDGLVADVRFDQPQFRSNGDFHDHDA